MKITAAMTKIEELRAAATLTEYLAAFTRPYPRLQVSYSYDRDDEWRTSRRRTCIEQNNGLRTIAERWYSAWRDVSLAYIAKQNEVSAIICRDHTKEEFEAALEARIALENQMEDLIERVKKSERIDAATRELVRHKLTYNPPVCNAGVLCAGGVNGKEFLDFLWHALVNSPVD